MLTELESSLEAKAIPGSQSISNQPLHQTRRTSSAAVKKEKEEAEKSSQSNDTVEGLNTSFDRQGRKDGGI